MYYSHNMTVFDELLMWFRGFTDEKKEDAGYDKAEKCGTEDFI